MLEHYLVPVPHGLMALNECSVIHLAILFSIATVIYPSNHFGNTQYVECKLVSVSALHQPGISHSYTTLYLRIALTNENLKQIRLEDKMDAIHCIEQTANIR